MAARAAQASHAREGAAPFRTACWHLRAYVAFNLNVYHEIVIHMRWRTISIILTICAALAAWTITLIAYKGDRRAAPGGFAAGLTRMP